jgi:hypothetical protein
MKHSLAGRRTILGAESAPSTSSAVPLQVLSSGDILN